jgi:MFS family permease
MMIVTRGWIILELTDSPFMVTAINAVPMLPMLAISPIGGVLADRFSRRSILFLGDGTNLLVLLLLAVLIMAGIVQVWHIFLLSFVHGLVFALVMPARMASVPDIIDEKHLASGVALFTTIFSTGMLAGPAPAGFLINAYGVGQTTLIASMALVPAMILLLFVKIPRGNLRHEVASRASFGRNIAEALAYIRGREILFSLIVMGVVVAIFNMPYQAILPIFARDIFHTGANGLGLLNGAIGIGALVGSLTVAATSTDHQLRFLLTRGGLGFGLLIILFSISWVFWISLVLALLLGIVMQVSLTSNMTIMQVALPSSIRGRVLSIRMVAIGLGPVGMFTLGLGSEILGVRLALGLMGTLSLMLFIVLLWKFSSLRRGEADVTDKFHPAPVAVKANLGTSQDGTQ